LLSIIPIFSFLAPLDPAFFDLLFRCGIWRFWALVFVRFKNIYPAVLILLVSYILKRIKIDVISKIVRFVPKIVEEVDEISFSILIICNL
jgi:hypothetical protein